MRLGLLSLAGSLWSQLLVLYFLRSQSKERKIPLLMHGVQVCETNGGREECWYWNKWDLNWTGINGEWKLGGFSSSADAATASQEV